MGQGSGFSDRRHHRRFQGEHRRSLHDRARLVPHPRQLEPGRGRPRHLGGRHHRNPLAGAEVPAGREDRRTAQREEAAAGRRRPRRVRRGHPPRDRAEIPRRRSRTADGIAVQADRAGKPDSAEPQRAGEGPHPQGARPRRMPARMARPSARRAAAPLQLPQGADRAPAGSARRLPDRLSQHRQGDQDHPHRGRAEAGADQGVQADGSPGRRHPQHAPAQFAQARGIRDPHRGQEPSRRVEGHQGAARLRGRAMVQGRRAGPESPRHLRAEDAARQAPHAVRRRARARSRRDRGSLCRARAGHRRGLREGLGARR